MNDYATVADFLSNATPGDTYTERIGRTMTTHVFVSRDDDGPNRGGTVDTISTHHYGRPEYTGRPGYCFRSIMQTLPMSMRRYDDGAQSARTIITRAYGLQHPATGLGTLPVDRFSAKRLQEAHTQAVALYSEHLAVA